MRYNIFNQAHRPLKLALLSTCISLSKDGEWDLSTAAETIKKVEEALQVFNEQVKYESLHILPFIFDYEPSVWIMYTSEHHKAMNLSYNLENLIRSFHELKDTEGRLTLMESISKSFNEFVLNNYNHMDDEEAVLNEILWRYYNDAFIRQIENEIYVQPGLVKQHKKTERLQISIAA